LLAKYINPAAPPLRRKAATDMLKEVLPTPLFMAVSMAAAMVVMLTVM
jgi:hypothetical protein